MNEGIWMLFSSHFYINYVLTMKLEHFLERMTLLNIAIRVRESEDAYFFSLILNRHTIDSSLRIF